MRVWLHATITLPSHVSAAAVAAAREPQTWSVRKPKEAIKAQIS